jgi:hypothetical protein
LERAVKSELPVDIGQNFLSLSQNIFFLSVIENVENVETIMIKFKLALNLASLVKGVTKFYGL